MSKLQDMRNLKNAFKGGDTKKLQEFFKMFGTMNENILFVQRNQCEQEAYLSLIAEKLEISKDEINKRIQEIQKAME